MIDLAGLEQSCEKFVAGMSACDPAHDLSHIKRVVNNARYLSDIENVNLLVTVPAAWLHDCVQVAKDDPRRAQVSRLAADEACRYLASIGYPECRLQAVHHAVEAHSFSAGIPVQSAEAGVVQDADRLDALGAIGIARCLLTGSALGSEIYHPDDPFCEHRAPEDRRYIIDHFYAKLFRLPETMQTDAGRAEAERRVAIMRSYLTQLSSEIGNA